MNPNTADACNIR